MPRWPRCGPRHDAPRAICCRPRGREIDKTDGFLLLFDTAADAVAYALAYHHALSRSTRRCRPAPGCTSARSCCARTRRRRRPRRQADRGRGSREADRRAGDVGRASAGRRCCQPTRSSSLGPTSLRLQSHGHWRMKGLAEPIELFEVGDADAPFTPPPDARRPTASCGKATCGCRCARSGTACRPSATRSSAAARRWQAGAPIRAGARLVVGARHRRHRQDAPRDALRLELARRLPRRRLVLRPVGGAQRRRHRLRRGAGARRAAGQGRPGRPARARHRRARPLPGAPRQLRAGGAPRAADPRPLARPRRAGPLRRDDARGAGLARRGGAGAGAAAARRRRRRCSCAGRRPRSATSSRTPRTSRPSTRWWRCSTACRWRSSSPRRGCA